MHKHTHYKKHGQDISAKRHRNKAFLAWCHIVVARAVALLPSAVLSATVTSVKQQAYI